MKTALGLASVMLFLLLTSSSCESEKGCPEDVICNMMFVTISVQIVDSAGKEIKLTKARVSSSFLENEINPLEEPMTGGNYGVLNDSHMQYLDNRKARPFLFEGWVDDALVVSQEYLIRHDCCHVVRESGPEQIVID